MKKKLIIILSVVLVLLIILAVIFGGKKDGTAVETEQAALRSITEVVSASGKIEPEVEVNISPEVSGEIIELPVKEGDHVEEGQLLVKINPDIYIAAVNRAEAAALSAQANLANARARLAQSKAQFEVAKRNWERNQNLHAQGAISDAELDQIQSTFEVAKADIDAAEESVKGSQFSVRSAQATLKEANDNLKRTTIYAPQTGTVNGLVVEKGERMVGTGMMGGTEMMRISDLGAMEVNVEVNESDIVRVSKGDTAVIEVDAYLNEKFKGIVTEIGNTALNSLGGSLSMDQVTNFSVKISILKESYDHLMNSGDSLISPFRPGMSATVDIMTEKAYNVLSIPIKAVTTRLDTSSSSFEKYRSKSQEGEEEKEPITCVFVNLNGKSKIKAVETGIQDNRYIEVKSGLSEGDEVVTGPYDAISRELSSDETLVVESSSKKDNEEE